MIEIQIFQVNVLGPVLSIRLHFLTLRIFHRHRPYLLLLNWIFIIFIRLDHIKISQKCS